MTGTDDGVATTRAPEVAVIGGGIVGLSTAYALREQGVPVRLYEAGLPGMGQSAGESRIFRHAHDDPRLVAFARERGVSQNPVTRGFVEPPVGTRTRERRRLYTWRWPSGRPLVSP